MGYLAIVNPKKEELISVSKTSETIFIKKNDNFTVFELEIMIDALATRPETLSVQIMIPGKIQKVQMREDLIRSSEFTGWYFASAQHEQNTSTVKFHGRHTTFLMKAIIAKHDYSYEQNISTLDVDFPLNSVPQDVKSVTTFFSYANANHTVKHFGNICSESRYFDRKVLPKNRSAYNYLAEQILVPAEVFCWFIIPRKYVAVDYTDCDNFTIRDLRIIEDTYLHMLNIFSWRKKRAYLADTIVGRPQVLHWRIQTSNLDKEAIFGVNEIRLFVTCTSYSFIYFAGMASILGFVTTILIHLTQ